MTTSSSRHASLSHYLTLGAVIGLVAICGYAATGQAAIGLPAYVLLTVVVITIGYVKPVKLWLATIAYALIVVVMAPALLLLPFMTMTEFGLGVVAYRRIYSNAASHR